MFPGDDQYPASVALISKHPPSTPFGVGIGFRHRADVHAGADGEGNQGLVAARVLAGLGKESMADQMEGTGFLQACRYQAGQALSLDLASG